ncbi:hypothetical protein ACI3PF_13910 [Lactococcus lactis]
MPKKFGRIHLVVMDSVGIGAAISIAKLTNSIIHKLFQKGQSKLLKKYILFVKNCIFY